MAEEIVPISPAIEAFGAVTGFLAKVPWARIWRVVSAPLAVPLAYLIDVLLVVFAPAIYIFQFFINSAQWTFSLLASLKVTPSVTDHTSYVVMLTNRPAAYIQFRTLPNPREIRSNTNHNSYPLLLG